MLLVLYISYSIFLIYENKLTQPLEFVTNSSMFFHF